MSLRCRLGWHDWRHWRPVRIKHRYLVRSPISGKRMPEDDFTEISNAQARTCRRCGLEETRR